MGVVDLKNLAQDLHQKRDVLKFWITCWKLAHGCLVIAQLCRIISDRTRSTTTNRLEHGKCLATSEKALINVGSYGDYNLQYFL